MSVDILTTLSGTLFVDAAVNRVFGIWVTYSCRPSRRADSWSLIQTFGESRGMS